MVDEEFLNNSCEDDTASERESNNSDVVNTYVEDSFGVLCVPGEDTEHIHSL